jgi:ribosomal protein S18 acetylase RimI-like enzyme
MQAITRLHVQVSQEAYAGILAEDYLRDVLPGEKENLWKTRLTGSFSDHTIFVADAGTQMAGFCCFLFNEQPELGTYLHNLYVSSSFRRRGVARSLLREAIATFDDPKQAQPVHLLVYGANSRAVELYHRLGGRVVDRTQAIRGAGSIVELLRYQWESALDLAARAVGK